MQLPYDIVVKILDYVPIVRLKRTFIGLYPQRQLVERKSYYQISKGKLGEELSKVVDSKSDPRIFFKDFQNTDNSFLDNLVRMGVVLIGLRAYSYYYPIKLDAEHPWDFICKQDLYSILSFIDYLDSIGVVWTYSNSYYDNLISNTISLMEGFIRTNTGKVKIRFTHASTADLTSMAVILRFPISCLQCVVSGHGAFDMNGKVHSQGKVRVWQDRGRLENHIYSTMVDEAVDICRQNNIQTFEPKGTRYFDADSFPETIERNLLDDNCINLYFTNFLTQSSRLSSEQMNKFSLIEWEECVYKLLFCGICSTRSLVDKVNTPKNMAKTYPSVRKAFDIATKFELTEGLDSGSLSFAARSEMETEILLLKQGLMISNQAWMTESTWLVNASRPRYIIF